MKRTLGKGERPRLLLDQLFRNTLGERSVLPDVLRHSPLERSVLKVVFEIHWYESTGGGMSAARAAASTAYGKSRCWRRRLQPLGANGQTDSGTLDTCAFSAAPRLGLDLLSLRLLSDVEVLSTHNTLRTEAPADLQACR